MNPIPKHDVTDLYIHSVVLPSTLQKTVNTIRTNGIQSRTDLAKQLGYSRATMTAIVKDLIDRGIVIETVHAESTGGRRAKLLNFNQEFGYIIGINMGATSVDIGIADFQANIRHRYSTELDVRDGPEAVLNRVIDITQNMIAECGIKPDEVISIGVGVPGPVDFLQGVLIAPPIMPGWEQYPIRQKFYQTYPKATVVVDNDVNVMAMGELRYGTGQESDEFIFVKVGTGIGCGIVADRKIYRGATGSAGDIGHIQADSNGPICHCGNIGCVEAMASGSAIARQAQELVDAGESPILAKYLQQGVKQLTAEHVGTAAHEGDKAAMEVIMTSGTLIGQVLAGVVNFFNPSQVIIGGGVSKIGTQFLSTIRRGILSRSLPLSTQHLRVDYSRIGENAGVAGAIALALEHVFVSES